MGLIDLENFLREKLLSWDPSLDVAAGSPVDAQVVQPLLQRVGTDPFTVDAFTFALTRLQQEIPTLAVGEGDAIEDLLLKPAMLLWDPIIREIQRIKEARSFASPELLTLEEAEALGSTFFKSRDTGSFSTGPARIYFAQPQQADISPANFFTSKTGLHFFPTGKQSIKAAEMSLNRENDLYYFDVNVVAEEPGANFNLDPGGLSTVANVAAAVRVTNKVAFRDGRPAESASDYVSRLDRSLSEKSMVSNRGIAAVVGESIPEVSSLAVIGFADPEMQRDVLSGGSLGPVLVSALDGTVVGDGTNGIRSRRFRSSSSNFFSLSPAGNVSGYVLTVVGGLGPGASPPIRDLEVARIISAVEVEVADQVLFPGATSVPFMVRRKELTLTGIPGGIVQPTGANGTVTMAHDKVHIGGCVDLFAGALSSETSTLVITSLADEESSVAGHLASVPPVGGGSPVLMLGDLILGTNYQVGDPTHTLLTEASSEQYAVQVLDGVLAGTYRILALSVGGVGDSPLLSLDPLPLAVSSALRFRWRLVTEVEIDLVEPKEIRVRGTDGAGSQNSNVFSTAADTDLGALGVAAADVLRIETGAFKGDYAITEVVSPAFTKLRLSRTFPSSFIGAKYQIFRANKAGGVQRPMLRVTSVDLLDTSSQPLGVKIPYSQPVDILSSAFSNVGVGVKHETSFTTTGIVGKEVPLAGVTFASDVLDLMDDRGVHLTVPLTGLKTMTQVASDINALAVASASIGVPIAFVSPSSLTTERLLIASFGENTRTGPGTTLGLLNGLFGNSEIRHARDVRDATSTPVDWAALSPSLDTRLDAIHVVDGINAGYFSVESVRPVSPGIPYSDSTAIRANRDLAPDVGSLVRVGSRSFGGARLYFLDPTSAEVGTNTVFTFTGEDGSVLRYFPDTTLSHQVVPPLPNGDKPGDGVSGGTVFSSGVASFIKEGVRPGYELELDFIPVHGTTTLLDPQPGLALLNIQISLGDRGERVVTFVNDVGTPGAVSRSGIAAQINSVMGFTVCSIDEVALGVHKLKFNTEVSLKVRRGGTANTALGFSTLLDTDNSSPHRGRYSVESVTATGLVVSPAFPASPASVSNGQYRVVRPASQRITTGEMSKQVAELGLYYWDVQLFSEGPGDAWNLPDKAKLQVDGFKGDGYRLSTLDKNTSLSPYESVRMHFSRSIMPVGVDDSPVNAMQLSGHSLSIQYDHGPVVATLQGLAMSDNERVVNASPLARHLVPHYVRLSVLYTGGSSESVIMPELTTLIRNVLPSDPLDSSDVQRVVQAKGATTIQNPLDMMAVVHGLDRSIKVTRSQNQLTTNRMAQFIPDKVTLTRSAR